jgi:hypothetical protein
MVEIHAYSIRSGPSKYAVTTKVLNKIHEELATLSTLERRAVLWYLAKAYDQYGDRIR